MLTNKKGDSSNQGDDSILSDFSALIGQSNSKITQDSRNRKSGQQGFASMSRDKQRQIASKGGRAAHQQGTAHEWSSEEAREAGRKGGLSKKENTGSEDLQETNKAA